MSPRIAYVEGRAVWSPSMAGWALARAALRDETTAAETPARRPAPGLLPAAERRRAPDTVALALEVAAQAVAESGRAPDELLSVFASAHGDLALTDYLCSTLATAPLLLSPTKFHNSVHNAASGYWGIATGCMQASTAISAFKGSFAAGLLEALVQCAAEEAPVLLVGYDIAATGALASTNDSRGLLAVALVLAPRPAPHTLATLEWTLRTDGAAPAVLRSPAAQALSANAMVPALALFEAMAREDEGLFALPMNDGGALGLRCVPVGATSGASEAYSGA